MSHPLLYEINTRCWLREFSARLGFTHLWLMGVWHTGPHSRAVGRHSPEVRGGGGGDAGRFSRGGHRRFAVCRRQLHGGAFPRQRVGVAGVPAQARPLRTETRSGFCPQLHGPRSSLAPGKAGAVCLQRGRSGRNLLAVDGRRAALAGAGPRSLFPPVARHRAVGLPQPGRAHRDAGNAPIHRAPVRRGALRHGDAGFKRGLRENVGRLSGQRCDAADGVLDGRHRGGERVVARISVSGRGVLGLGGAAAGTGL